MRRKSHAFLCARQAGGIERIGYLKRGFHVVEWNGFIRNSGG
jgi:hypothetical protein